MARTTGSGWERRRGNLASSALLMTVVVAMVATMFAADGYETPEFDLHDAGIWLSSEKHAAIGRLNAEIEAVDTRIDVAAEEFELLQSGPTVLVHHGAALSLVDARMGTMGPESAEELPGGAQLALGGPEGTTVVADGSGRVFVGSPPAIMAADFEGGDPALEAGGPALVAVGPLGVAHVLAADGALTRVSVDGTVIERTSVDLDRARIEGLKLSVVGEQSVVLDTERGRLLQPGRPPVDLAPLGSGLVLQQPGAASDHVVVASDDKLALVPLRGGEPVVLTSGAGGGPAEPVWLDGCAYGAWAGAGGTWVWACSEEVALEDLGDVQGEVRIRVNRGRVVINDLATGTSYLLVDGVAKLIPSDWAEAPTEEPEGEDEDTDQDRPEQECGKVDPNVAPEALDDEISTRPDRPVLVHALDNDEDANCDVLLVTALDRLPRDVDAVVEIADGGRDIQVTVGAALSSFTFDYEVGDGRGGTGRASVRVTVRPADENEPPLARPDETVVEPGATVAHNVLVNDVDPDGDLLSLVGATVAEGDGVVQVQADGLLRYSAPPDLVAESVAVEYVVEDEVGLTAESSLTVEVVPAGKNVPPSANDDHAVTEEGREVVVDVLANDTDANGDRLSIAKVTPVTKADGFEVTWSAPAREIRVRAETAGSYRVDYTITDSQATHQGVLRVEVRSANATRSAPVAVRDDIVVRPGVATLVAVLDNDYDPDGDVLVVQSLALPDAGNLRGLRVELLERRLLRVSAPTAFPGAVVLRYTITDGSAQDTGIVVVRAAVSALEQAPVVVNDEVTVRSGNVITIDALANDSDPDGDSLSFADPPTEPLAAADGTLFRQGDVLRYQAPEGREIGAVRARYHVVDDLDPAKARRASGEIVIHVTTADPAVNKPPVAPRLEARVIAGHTVRIPVPVGAMDPDGDPVTLLGVDSEQPPTRGGVLETATDHLVYAADRGESGTDSFKYRVRDAYGLGATGIVMVGIAPKAGENNPPFAGADEAFVRPGDEVVVDVLANDGDPDGDAISLSRDDGDLIAPALGEARRDGDRVVFDASGLGDGSETLFSYAVVDAVGNRAVGEVRVRVTSSIPNRAPVAIDDVVAPQAAGEVVRIPVLGNDSDPDGNELRVTAVSRADARITPDGTVELMMPEAPVTFTYEVTDAAANPLTARAVVFVPHETNRPPVPVLDEAVTDLGADVEIDVLGNDTDDGGEVHLIDVIGTRHGTARIDGDVVVFTPTAEYVGTGGFSYVVGDTADPGTALTAVGTAIVEIKGAVNSPPRWRGIGRVEVVAGGEVEVALVTGVDDRDVDDEHSFSDIRGATDAVAAELAADGTLRISAATDAEPGTVVPMKFTVADRAGDEVDATVDVGVVTSDKPLPVANADETTTHQGKAVTIAVLDNDTDPVGEGLRVVSAAVASSDAGQVRNDDQQVTFTPAAKFFGTVAIQYYVEDGTKDPARLATGTVSVTVIGRPDLPSAPTAVAESRAVTLTWTVPADNGGPITEYRIRATDLSTGSVLPVQRSTSNTHRFTGLTNGREYTFAIAAINEAVDAPEFGPASAPVMPDELPQVPQAPTAVFGDSAIRVSWKIPPVDGSPVVHVKLWISPPASGVEHKVFAASETSHVWEGLANGTAYTFQVQATNDRGADPVYTERSPASLPETPAGVPFGLSAPDAVKGDKYLTVSWDAPAKENGDDVDGYYLQVVRAGEVVNTIEITDPAVRRQQVVTDNGVEYTFQVRAYNKAGRSEWSAASESRVSAGRPFPIGAVSATEGDTQSVLTFEAPNRNGSAITGYEVSVDGGEAWTPVLTDPGVTMTVGGLSNGTSYSFLVRACNAEGCADPSPKSNTVVPYGAPSTAVTLTRISDGPRRVRAGVSMPDDLWNGRPAQSLKVTVAGQEVQLPTNGGSADFDVTWGSTTTATVTACSTRKCASAVSNPVTVLPPTLGGRWVVDAHCVVDPNGAPGLGDLWHVEAGINLNGMDARWVSGRRARWGYGSTGPIAIPWRSDTTIWGGWSPSRSRNIWVEGWLTFGDLPESYVRVDGREPTCS